MADFAQSRHRSKGPGSKGPGVSIGEACFEQQVMGERPGRTKQTECAHVLRPLPERTRSRIARPSDRPGDRQRDTSASSKWPNLLEDVKQVRADAPLIYQHLIWWLIQINVAPIAWHNRIAQTDMLRIAKLPVICGFRADE